MTEKTKELNEQVMLHLMRGRTLDEICKIPGMPGLKTLKHRVARNKELRKTYRMVARDAAYKLITESIAIADRPKNTMKEVVADSIMANNRLSKAKSILERS